MYRSPPRYHVVVLQRHWLMLTLGSGALALLLGAGFALRIGALRYGPQGYQVSWHDLRGVANMIGALMGIGLTIGHCYALRRYIQAPAYGALALLAQAGTTTLLLRMTHAAVPMRSCNFVGPAVLTFVPRERCPLDLKAFTLLLGASALVSLLGSLLSHWGYARMLHPQARRGRGFVRDCALAAAAGWLLCGALALLDEGGYQWVAAGWLLCWGIAGTGAGRALQAHFEQVERDRRRRQLAIARYLRRRWSLARLR